MAFVKVVKSAGLGHAVRLGQPSIRFGAHLADNKHPRSIYISITPETIDQVGWEVETAKSQRQNRSGETYERAFCRIAFNEGVGEDAGFIQLSEDRDRGYIIGTTKGLRTSFTASIGMAGVKHYVFNEIPVDPDDVEFTIDPDDKTILIQCPDWLRYNPQSYAAPAPAKEVPSSRPPQLDMVEEVVVNMPNTRLSRSKRRHVGKEIARALAR